MNGLDGDGKRQVHVAILTPFLSYNFKADCEGRKDGKFEARVAILETTDVNLVPCKVFADFAIAGQSTLGEMEVYVLKGSGLIVARYSKFYPGNSEYTHSSPERAGYSLDIPKKEYVVKDFLSNDRVLEALLSRNEERIEFAVDVFNRWRSAPVLITPYLKEALRVKRNG
ncbi:MAG: hypothetical protein NTW67_06415 [Candidatus Woesearchaeota archaeon]|nr:hypothetical protein [Candidatus Woesearchaeota archaeon]